MTTKTIRGSAPSSKAPDLAPTLGPQVCRWMEANLVHAEGDLLGKPFRLHRFEKAFIWRAYELRPDGQRRYRRAIWGMPSGNGKTEIAAAIADAELGGPVVCAGFDARGRPIGARRTSPDIPVAAASFEQADLLFGAAGTMLREGPLREFFDLYDTEILPKRGGGRLYRVAAKAGTNDGKRPTFVVADELHEWECTCGMPGGKHVGACKARVYVVLSKGRAKRRDAWELVISTAGWNLQSLLGAMYLEGKQGNDPTTLFEWWEASDQDVQLSDDGAVTAAVLEANPAIGAFLSLENVLADRAHMSEFEFRRYHLNQWVSAPERWLPEGTWEKLARPEQAQPPEGADIVLGFDGSYAGDSTGIVGATLDAKPHVFVIGAWEKDAEDKEWRVDILGVEQAIRDACAKWNVVQIGCDPFRWQRSLAVLQDEGFPVIEWPSHQPSHMVPACGQFYDAVTTERLTQDGDPRLARHIANAVVKIDGRGPRITKDHRDSVRRIDLAVAGVIAHDLVIRNLSEANDWRPV
jgi:phage terminase large subunit-like protein